MSTLRVNSLLNAAGTDTPAIDGLAKAWVNFNGTGTVAIRASLNVSSITDNGTGNYTVNFANAMPDANYCAISKATNNGSAVAADNCTNFSRVTTSAQFRIVDGGGSAIDRDTVLIVIFR